MQLRLLVKVMKVFFFFSLTCEPECILGCYGKLDTSNHCLFELFPQMLVDDFQIHKYQGSSQVPFPCWSEKRLAIG